MVDALVYEGNRTDEEWGMRTDDELTGSTTGACLEYFLRHDILANLERLCERDRPRGIKGEFIVWS
jgi:hypothetical protein